MRLVGQSGQKIILNKNFVRNYSFKIIFSPSLASEPNGLFKTYWTPLLQYANTHTMYLHMYAYAYVSALSFCSHSVSFIGGISVEDAIEGGCTFRVAENRGSLYSSVYHISRSHTLIVWNPPRLFHCRSMFTRDGTPDTATLVASPSRDSGVSRPALGVSVTDSGLKKP